MVTLHHDAVLGSTHIAAGKYGVRWQGHNPDAAVQFVNKHAIVVSTEGRVEQRNQFYERNAVVYSTGTDGTVSIMEIRFANSNKVLVFNSAANDVKVARR